MDRKDFSSRLVVQREANNLGKNELCRLTGFTFVQLQRLEKADNNYNMELVFRYLSVVRSSIILQKDKKEYCLTHYEQVPQWLSEARGEVLSLRKLAEIANCSYSAITNVEHGKTVISVDLFLKLIDVLGYSVEIKLVGQNKQYMTREEFCRLMEQAKTSSNLTISEISFSMKMLLPTLRRFEKGKHNFSLVKVMEYLSVLKSELVITGETLTVFCTDYDQLVHWLVSERQLHGYSLRALAEVSGISFVMLNRIESRKSDLSIDMFLKIAQVFGCDIDIRPCGEKTDNK